MNLRGRYENMKKETVNVESKDTIRKKLRRKYLISLCGDALGIISIIFLVHAQAQNSLSLMIWTTILNTFALVLIISGNFFVAAKEYKQVQQLSAQELKEMKEELDKFPDPFDSRWLTIVSTLFFISLAVVLLFGLVKLSQYGFNEFLCFIFALCFVVDLRSLVKYSI